MPTTVSSPQRKSRRGAVRLNTGASSGPSVDQMGSPVIDPTENVISLQEQATARQDDLRNADMRYMMAELAHVREMMALRAEHNKEIGALESGRLNAIRQVDQLAVNTAADRSAQAVAALAATAATNADNLRVAMNTTASTIAAQLAATVTTITERIAALEKSSYEGVGRSKVADPMMAELVTEMKKLSAGSEKVTGERSGLSMAWVALVGGVSLLVMVLGGGVTLYSLLKPAPPPPIQYVPLPPGAPGSR